MKRKGFTLLELLIVIGILAVLTVTAALVINPAEYLRQSRDGKRIADIDMLNIGIAEVSSAGVSLGGASTTVYVSLVDTVATCANLGLPPLPTGYQYHCVTTAGNVYKVDGNGWIPINFASTPGGSSVTLLPTDPVNNATYFYTYIPGGSFALAATLESSKYLKQSAMADGGTNPAKIEMGSDLKLLAKAEGLVGYWPFDEGSGLAVIDASGNGNTGTWYGAGAHYGQGQIGMTGQFNGASDYVTVPSSGIKQNAITVSAWVKPQDPGVASQTIGIANKASAFLLRTREATSNAFEFFVYLSGVPEPRVQTAIPAFNTWYYVAVTYDSSGGANNLKMYVNGILKSTQTRVGTIDTNANQLVFAKESNYLPGSIDDLRIYSRSLSASEIQAMYTASK